MQILQHGESFEKHDDVLYIIDVDKYNEMSPDIDDDEEHVCAHCNKPNKRKGKVLIECDYCLRPYHLACIKNQPADGAEWMCPMCEAQEPLPSDPPTRHIDVFLRTPGIIGVGHVVRLFLDGNKQKRVVVQKYMPRQNGPQDSIACEIHATEETEEFDAHQLICHVTVAGNRDDYETATTDAFICQSKFNAKLGVYEPLDPKSKVLPICTVLLLYIWSCALVFACSHSCTSARFHSSLLAKFFVSVPRMSFRTSSKCSAWSERYFIRVQQYRSEF